ncbi:MAG: hypothetical protein ACRBCS_02955 [Cellvibrionaceae bacterium]
MFLIRASSVGKLMASAKSKKPEDLSAGAITYCKQLAKEFVYSYQKEINSKYLDKGIICEDQSIELYNDVFFTSHIKNTERKETDYLTGECDINGKDRIIDIKTAWSLDTFPAFKEDVHSSDYEWQGRAYMKLWDKDLFELAYCLVSTPDDLTGYESDTLHYVEEIPKELRVTSALYERDKEKEELIEIKCRAAQKFINEAIQTIAEHH